MEIVPVPESAIRNRRTPRLNWKAGNDTEPLDAASTSGNNHQTDQEQHRRRGEIPQAEASRKDGSRRDGSSRRRPAAGCPSDPASRAQADLSTAGCRQLREEAS